MYKLQEIMSGRLHLPSAPWHVRVSHPSCCSKSRTACIGTGPSPSCLAIPHPRHDPQHTQQQHRKKRRMDCSVRAACCSGASPLPPQQNYNPPREHHHGNHSHFPDSFLTGFFERLGLVAAAERVMHSGACLWASVLGFFVASLVEIPALSVQLPQGTAPMLAKAALCIPWVLSGAPQILESLCMAASGTLNTHVLMALAALGTLYMGMPQEGALLLLLFQLSHTLEEHFTSRARGNLARLFASVPDKAHVVEVDPTEAQPLFHTQQQCLAGAVGVGQHVLVNSGENVPLDGVVVWGTASVSLQHISGESAPVRAATGSEVPAGSVNLDGSLVLRVQASMEDSTPARIARMAAQAQANRPKLQRTLDRVGEVWSKAVIAATLAALVGLLAVGVPLLGPRGAFYRAMGVLTAGSPCAVVLVPLAYVCAIATITRKGVLVKSAAAIDALLTCSTIALDKTGTITGGALKLVDASVFAVSPSIAIATRGREEPSSTLGGAAAVAATSAPGSAPHEAAAAATTSAANNAPHAAAGQTGQRGAAASTAQPAATVMDTQTEDERKQSHASASSSHGPASVGTQEGFAGEGGGGGAPALLLRPLHIPRRAEDHGTNSDVTLDSHYGDSSSSSNSGDLSGREAGDLQGSSMSGSSSISASSISRSSSGGSAAAEGGDAVGQNGHGLSNSGNGTHVTDYHGLINKDSSMNGSILQGTSQQDARAGSQRPLGVGLQSAGPLEQRALQYAVALSRFSNHPVSHAVVEQLGPLVDTQGVQVHGVQQVPGAGVQGLCLGGRGAEAPEFVSFGSLNFIRSCLPAGPAREQLDRAAAEQARLSSARAQSFLLATPNSHSARASSTPNAPSTSINLNASGALPGAQHTHSTGLEGVASAASDGELGGPGLAGQEVAVLCFEDEVQPDARFPKLEGAAGASTDGGPGGLGVAGGGGSLVL
ncbi:E1-E2 ATPase-domain-containing protein [Dunaliella salina]|uniref:E1-E2 ATPase-domain-containing protein n=1 Tax=Dunaliella salina TaxID=3046 RepID=A0ABQ7G4D0_DUNSA|nr:E1-E2 ATPase-domain-containing protein [Dunaliella salina]|eukprot:KAF5829456.1 E1-E2 ATPase-domain-containing protein [Dunaliella salina]